jgi:hypothetical protein
MQLATNVRRRDFLIFRLSSLVCPGFFFWLQVVFALLLVWLAYGGAEPSGPMFVGATLYFIGAWVFLLAGTMLVAVLEVLFITALKKGVLGEHRFELTSEGLLEETSVNRTLHAWSSVDGSRKLMGALIVRAGAGWHIFPRACFSASFSREILLETIRTFRTQNAA